MFKFNIKISFARIISVTVPIPINQQSAIVSQFCFAIFSAYLRRLSYQRWEEHNWSHEVKLLSGLKKEIATTYNHACSLIIHTTPIVQRQILLKSMQPVSMALVNDNIIILLHIIERNGRSDSSWDSDNVPAIYIFCPIETWLLLQVPSARLGRATNCSFSSCKDWIRRRKA